MAGFDIRRRIPSAARGGYGYARPLGAPPMGRMSAPDPRPVLPEQAAPQARVQQQAVATPEQTQVRPQPTPVRAQPGRLAPQNTAQNSNTARAVNSTVVRVTPEQLDAMASNPALGPFVRQLMELEKRGMAQLMSNPRAAGGQERANLAQRGGPMGGGPGGGPPQGPAAP